MSPAIEFRGVGKSFPGVRALDGMSLAIAPGECHGLIGENGAGKSTLMKLLAGLYQPSAGEIHLFGKPADLRSPAAAQALGVAMIHQELNLVDELSVADNIFLGREQTKWGTPGKLAGIVDRAAQEAAARKALAALHCDSITPSTRVGELSIAQKQMVEIAKALNSGARILIMDEPTAVLGSREVQALFDLIARLKRDGVTLLYISHHLPEILEVCDRVTVLRDGQKVTTLEREDLAAATESRLADLMVGRALGDYFPARKPHTDDVVLDVRNVRGVSFTVRRGEIFGLAGLIGAGRTELGEAIAGLRPSAGGTVHLNGQPLRIRSPRDAIRHGIAYLSEDRKGTGLTLGMSVIHNTTLASLHKHTRLGGLLNQRSERKVAEHHIASLRVRTAGPDQLIENLSGGNQQKVALAKWLETDPKVLIIDEPTRGVDVGAKEQIYHLLQQLTDRGLAVVLISSELNEVLGLAHRIGVMRSGQLVTTLDGPSATEQQVMQHAAGALST